VAYPDWLEKLLQRHFKRESWGNMGIFVSSRIRAGHPRGVGDGHAMRRRTA
jgi:hypothetical protein